MTSVRAPRLLRAALHMGVAVAITSLSLSSAAVFAQSNMAPPPGMQGGPHAGPGGPRPMGGPLLAGIVLSDAQKGKIDAIFQQESSDIRARMHDAEQARDQLDSMVWSGSFDDGRAHAIAAQGAKTLTELAVAHARLESQILAVLTPEQRAQAKKNHDEMAKFGPRGDHGPSGGPGGPGRGGPADGGDQPPPPPGR